MRLKRCLTTAAGALCAFFFAIALLTGLLRAASVCQPAMLLQFRIWAPPEATGLPAEEYSGVAQMITRYLSGDSIPFQYTITDSDGTRRILFRENEQTHMADCLQLLRLDGRVMLYALIGLLLMLAFAALLRDPPRFLHGLQWGLLGVPALMAVLLIWATIDFRSLFLLFHRLSFSNDLWLMDPRTDLIIRLMPETFFLSYLVVIAVLWIAVMLIVLAAVRHARKHRP